jgi:hypothetical protein
MRLSAALQRRARSNFIQDCFNHFLKDWREVAELRSAKVDGGFEEKLLIGCVEWCVWNFDLLNEKVLSKVIEIIK